MTHYQRMVAALYHAPTDRIPWAPRMDLWYIANKARGTLPEGFDGLNTVEMAKKLGVGCHAVRADYTLPRPKESLILRGLAVDNHPDYPYRLELKRLPYSFEHDDENLRTTIETKAGPVSTHIFQSKDMSVQGISVPFTKHYPLRYPLASPSDLDAVAEVYEHIEVIPTPENYAAFRARMGDQGLAVAHGLNIASPIHLMLHDLMSMNDFFLFYMDEPDTLRALAERIAPFFDRVLEATLACDCEAFFWGGNYDHNTTYPDLFDRDIKPWLNKVGKKAEAAGKRVVTHTDGENCILLPHYAGAGFHVAESVCTVPMTNLSLKQFRDGIDPGVTVWGGIPAVALMENGMSEGAFDEYLDILFAELGDARGLILGVSDNVPPDLSFPRFEKVRERIERHGPTVGA